jgi:hypothetical protein
VEFPALSSYVYVARPGAPEIVQARQWAARTNVEQLAEWCEGWTYTGNQHGHTSPPWAEHTCLNLEVREDSPKGHADPADWIVRHEDGTYEIIPPGQFTAGAGAGRHPRPPDRPQPRQVLPD